MRIAEIKETLYAEAVVSAENGQYPEAQAIFFRLGDYSDSENRIQYYQIRHIEDGIDCDNPDYLMTVYGLYREMAGYLDCDERAQNLKNRADYVVSGRYAQVVESLEKQEFGEAIQILEHFGEYGNEDVEKHYYLIAEAMLENHSYEMASKAFRKAGDYSDAKERILEPYYVQAEELLAVGEYDSASQAFARAGSYKNAVERVYEPYYTQALGLMESGNYDAASEMFAWLGEKKYGNAKERIGEPYYVQAKALLAEGRILEAVEQFTKAGDYSDAKEQIGEIWYEQGEKCIL